MVSINIQTKPSREEGREKVEEGKNGEGGKKRRKETYCPRIPQMSSIRVLNPSFGVHPIDDVPWCPTSQKITRRGRH
jgi:hypothetical protein